MANNMTELENLYKNINALPPVQDKNKWWRINSDLKPIDKKSNDIILGLFKRLDISTEDNGKESKD